MTATTLLLSWLVLGQTATLPVPVAAPTSRRANELRPTLVASPRGDGATNAGDDMRSVLTARDASNQINAEQTEEGPAAMGVQPISAQPLRLQPTVAPPQSPNPPGQQVQGAAFSQPARGRIEQPLGQSPAAGQGLAKRLVTQAFPSGVGEPTTGGVSVINTDAAAAPLVASPGLSLRAALATTTDRARQLAIIKTYWEASSLLADWQFAREELQLVDDLAAPRSPAEQAALAAAQTAAQARLVEAEMASITARYALGDAAGGATDEPPLPSDLPFVGKYRTEFESVFAGRAVPVGVKRIHATLPLRRELVDARAAAVVAGVNSLDEQIGAYRSGQLALAQVLASMISLRLQRGAFLGAVRDYNLDIAEYALAAAQPSDPPEKIVAMLIELDPSEDLRSVLVTPQTARVVEPVTGAFTAAAELVVPPRFSGTTATAPNRISSPAVLSRPSTERVLGSFRDVTQEAPPAEAEIRPRSSFGAAGGQSDLPPSLPPR